MSKLWNIAKIGKPPAFKSPEDMWTRAVEYFEWCEENSLQEHKVFNNQGEIVTAKVPLMRAMTQAGLCAFLNIGTSTWHDYKAKDNYSAVTQLVESIMYEQKFSGASAGLLNANIIARDLGLADKSEQKLSGGLIVDTPLSQRLTGASKR